jgi:hypothetical protein
VSRIIQANRQSRSAQCEFENHTSRLRRGAYLPWTKEERRASTSKGHHQIWINHLSDRVGEIRLREFRTVGTSRMLRAIAKEKVLTRTTLHIKSVLSTIFTYAKNDGAFDGANPVDGELTFEAHLSPLIPFHHSIVNRLEHTAEGD